MNFSTLSIVALGKNKQDERITILPFWSDHQLMCNVVHTIPSTTTTDGKKSKYHSVYHIGDICGYMYTILNLIMADEEPKNLYQFDIPGIPSILVSHKEIKNILSTILDHVDYLCNNENAWPKVKQVNEVNEVKVEKPQLPPAYRCNTNTTFTMNPCNSGYSGQTRPNSHIFFDEEDGMVINSY
jgi:hypothetical protein